MHFAIAVLFFNISFNRQLSLAFDLFQHLIYPVHSDSTDINIQFKDEINGICENFSRTQLTSQPLLCIIIAERKELLSMLNAFGKALRKLRIDHQELLKDMADHLGVSAAYLSAVENGKRKVPTHWPERISTIYALSNPEREALQQAADDSITEVTILLGDTSAQKRATILSFARALDGLSDDDLVKIMDSINRKNKRKGNNQNV